MSKKYAFIYPGQGSQGIGMGREFYDNFSEAKDIIQRASDILKLDFKDLLFNENDKLNLTQFTQPAIFLISYIAHTLLKKECDISPHISFGHSLGEISAVACSGGIAFDKAIYLTHKRGEYMDKACRGKNAGMMVVLGLDDDKVESFVKDRQQDGKSIWCANYNMDGQIVLAGDKNDLLASEGDIKALGAKRAMLLNMSVASHCPLINDAIDEFKILLDSSLEDSFGDVLSNATVEIYNTKTDALNLLSAQLINPVKYKQSIAKIESSIDGFIELGHGSVLKGLNARLSAKKTINVNNLSSLRDSISTIMETI